MLSKSGPCLQKDIELQLVAGKGVESGFVTPIDRFHCHAIKK